MAAARKGRAMKIRRSTPIFHTVRQASPSDGGISTGMSSTTGSDPSAAAVGARPSSSATGSPRSDASICSLSSTCSWRPRGGSRRRRPTSTTTTMGTAKKKNGARHVNTAASPAPRRTPTMAPMLIPERWAEYTRGRAGTG